jgi:hypothetical protein
VKCHCNTPACRAAAAKVSDLLATRKTGTFFLQPVKEPMPEDAAPAPNGAVVSSK